jgi:uncharacterized protein (DUF433 family)
MPSVPFGIHTGACVQMVCVRGSMNRAELFRNYPELEPADVQQALLFAAANLEDRASENPAA